MDVLLNMFGGDRSNKMYQEIRALSMCDLTCKCGFNINRKASKKKTSESLKKNDEKRFKCTTTSPLFNHVNFPTLSTLGFGDDSSPVYYESDGELKNHWCLLIDINEIMKEKSNFYGLKGFTTLNEQIDCFFCRDEDYEGDITKYSNPDTFSWSDLKPGHTVAILYAEKENITDWSGVIQRDLDSVYVFKAPFLELYEEAKLLLNDADLRHEKKDLECFGCGVKSQDLKVCASCKLAKYCSKDCQAKSWKLRHKHLCGQSEMLLRLTCLPRQKKLDDFFTFRLNDDSNCLPPYVYSSEHVQSFIDIVTNKPIEKPSKDTKCGLCGKTNQECFLTKGKGLCKTYCCNNWVCDDNHTYKMASYKLNSCWRNHNRYTLCGSHYDSKHDGDWKTCKKCKSEFSGNKVAYVDHATNRHNFEKLKNVKKEIIECRNCGFESTDLSDFIGSTPCCALDVNYYCKRAECKKAGGFDDIADDNTFMFKANLK